MDHFFSNNDNDDHIEEKISLDELYNRKREVEQFKLGVYRKILGRVHVRIKTAARQKLNNNYTFFVIPEFIFGVPKYNTETCASYLIEKLQDNGFVVKYTHPNMLFISWGHYIPSYEREKIKKETGISIDGFGNEIKKKDKLVTFKEPEKTLSNKSSSSSGKQFKDISTYKPSGIYNMDLITRIQDKINKN